MNAYVDYVTEKIDPPKGAHHYVENLWSLREMCATSDDPVTPDLLSSWASSMGVSLSRRERVIIHKMDAAFRKQYPKTVAYHERRRERKNKMGSK